MTDLEKLIFERLKNCKIRVDTRYGSRVLVIRKTEQLRKLYFIGEDDNGFSKQGLSLSQLKESKFTILEENVPLPKRKVKREARGYISEKALESHHMYLSFSLDVYTMKPNTENDLIPVTITYEVEEDIE